MISRREFVAGTAALALSGCANGGMPSNSPPPNAPTPVPMSNNSLLASDNFQRTGPSLGANWTALPGGAVTGQIVSNQVEPTAATATDCSQYYSAISWPNDQVSEVVIGTGWTNELNTTLKLHVRVSGTSSLTCYQVNLSNNAASMYKQVSGTVTQFGSTVTGLTIASGDVWSFAAFGPCIVLYQNAKLIFFWVDTAVTSGSPGFGNVTSVNVTHTTVATWRGYNQVQQDGIWQKQGSANIPLVATDINTGSSFGNSGIDSSTIILHEGNAQILSGTVYKQWFGTQSGIQYAESTDCKNWSRYASTVIAGFTFPQILKSGSTYYLYAQSNTVAVGSTAFTAFTSSDGINWTNQGSTGIGLGTSGQWDQTAVYLFSPVYIDTGGTWHALYSGVNGTAFAMGLATSSNGLTWTKYGSNPVATQIYASTPYLINGVWYLWAETTPPGQVAGSGNPTVGVRLQSVDLINWTNRTLSIQHSQFAEDVNGTIGFSYPNALITVGNQTYMYLESGPSNTASTTGASWNLALAIAPAPMASLVLFPENATKQSAADNFQRANGSLGANWVTPTGASALQIASNLVEPTAINVHCTAAYTVGGASSLPQYSEVTIAALSGTSAQVSALVYLQTGSLSGYYGLVGGVIGSLVPNGAQIYKATSGTFVLLAQNAITPQSGDVIRCAVTPGSDGSNVLSLYQNGYLIAQGQDYAATYTSGYPGVDLYNATAITDSQASAWAGGNANVIPAYPPSGGGAGDLGPGYDFKFRL